MSFYFDLDSVFLCFIFMTKCTNRRSSSELCFLGYKYTVLQIYARRFSKCLWNGIIHGIQRESIQICTILKDLFLVRRGRFFCIFWKYWCLSLSKSLFHYARMYFDYIKLLISNQLIFCPSMSLVSFLINAFKS